jgi:hypothetical protein
MAVAARTAAALVVVEVVMAAAAARTAAVAEATVVVVEATAVVAALAVAAVAVAAPARSDLETGIALVARTPTSRAVLSATDATPPSQQVCLPEFCLLRGVPPAHAAATPTHVLRHPARCRLFGCFRRCFSFSCAPFVAPSHRRCASTRRPVPCIRTSCRTATLFCGPLLRRPHP